MTAFFMVYYLLQGSPSLTGPLRSYPSHMKNLMLASCHDHLYHQLLTGDVALTDPTPLRNDPDTSIRSYSFSKRMPAHVRSSEAAVRGGNAKISDLSLHINWKLNVPARNRARTRTRPKRQVEAVTKLRAPHETTHPTKVSMSFMHGVS